MNDLIERLRKYKPTSGYARYCNQAADEIERLRDHKNYVVTPAFKKGHVVGVICNPYGRTEYYVHDNLDAAFDSAMKGGA